jgi:hypothetical protein
LQSGSESGILSKDGILAVTGSSVMSHALICSWLALPEGEWPPDHFRLLGLTPDEATPERVEQQVHQRLEMVRQYQLLHPELVTEAMNRLAQAYLCLSDPVARRKYEAARPATSTAAPGVRTDRKSVGTDTPPPPPKSKTGPADTAAGQRTEMIPVLPTLPLVEPLKPVAVPVPPEPEPEPAMALPVETPPAAIPVEEESSRPVAIPVLIEEPATLPLPRVDPAIEAARSSRTARRGLGTKRSLYRRVVQIRRVAMAWEALGKYLSDPKRKLTRPSEATELINQLKDLRATLEAFPPMLGQAGQPGYSVVVLARQQTPVPIFQTLLLSQRDILAQHWQSGLQFLQTHRAYLRQELASLRKKSALGRAVRTVRHAIVDQPAYLLLLLALIALNVAIWRQYVSLDWLRERPAATSQSTERR